MTPIAEVWLRGPVDGIVPLLQPAAHTILQVGEDVLPIVADLPPPTYSGRGPAVRRRSVSTSSTFPAVWTDS